MKHCKSPRSGELVCYLVAAIGSVVTGGSGITIVFFCSLVRRITKAIHKYHPLYLPLLGSADYLPGKYSHRHRPQV